MSLCCSREKKEHEIGEDWKQFTSTWWTSCFVFIWGRQLWLKAARNCYYSSPIHHENQLLQKVNTTFTSREKKGENKSVRFSHAELTPNVSSTGPFSPHHPPSQVHLVRINAGLCIDLWILHLTYTCMKCAPENTHWQMQRAAWYPGGQD